MTAGAAIVWLSLGLAPTLAAAGWYAAQGLWAVLVVRELRLDRAASRLPCRPARECACSGIGAQLAPLAVAAVIGWRGARPCRAAGGARLAAGGARRVPRDRGHGSIIMRCRCSPRSRSRAAPALGRRPRLLVATLGLMRRGLGGRAPGGARRRAGGARAVATMVARESRGDCPYVFIGDTITYLLARACTPTAYAFPNLLAYATEQGATGIDEAREVRTILARRPRVIVTSDRRLRIWNRGSLAALKAALPDYRLALRVPRSGWHTLVYVRRPLISRVAPPSRAAPPAPP